MAEINCDRHGNQLRSAIVCQHLFSSLESKKIVGFSEPWEEIDENESFEAWCDECEKVLEIEKGWTDKSEAFADFKLICEKCYEFVKKLNS